MSVIVQVLNVSWTELPVGSDSYVQAIAEVVNDENDAVEAVVNFEVANNHGHVLWREASETRSVPAERGVEFHAQIPASAFSAEPGFYWVRANCYDDLNDPKQTLVTISDAEVTGHVEEVPSAEWEAEEHHHH
jgi:hypothetical protein